MPQPVIIETYNPGWPIQFQALKEAIANALGDIALGIEHVGSTSVVGLSAKPIIDIDVVIRSRDDLPAAVEALANIGYEHEGNLGIEDRGAFKSNTEGVAHHLYVCSQYSEELRRHILFRDYLRAHVEAATAYAEIKRAAATRFRSDRNGYGVAKSEFVAEILRRAERLKS